MALYVLFFSSATQLVKRLSVCFDWLAAATMCDLYLCNCEVEEVQTWQKCSYHGDTIDPVTFNIKIALRFEPLQSLNVCMDFPKIFSSALA